MKVSPELHPHPPREGPRQLSARTSPPGRPLRRVPTHTFPGHEQRCSRCPCDASFASRQTQRLPASGPPPPQLRKPRQRTLRFGPSLWTPELLRAGPTRTLGRGLGLCQGHLVPSSVFRLRRGWPQPHAWGPGRTAARSGCGSCVGRPGR